MDTITKRNLKAWIETNLDKFPKGYKFQDFENSTPSVQDALVNKLYSVMGYKGNYQNYTIKKSDFAKIPDFNFSTTLMNRLKKTTTFRIENEKKLLRAKEPAPQWDEIDPTMQNNFKRWLSNQTKKYDEKFSVNLFDELPDHIKVDFYLTLATRFGVDNYYDLRAWKRSTNKLRMGVKDLKISTEIQAAIYDVIPVDTGILKTIKKSEMDDWDAEQGVATADSHTQQEIDAAREQRKFDKKRAKLLGRIRTIKSLEQYQVTLNDPLFDRYMFETILNRMNQGTAFKDVWKDQDSKEIIKLIVNHPLATTADLVRIKNIKTNQYGGKQNKYNSSHLNTALAGKEDVSVDELMKMIKLQQYDLKVQAIKRKDLSPADKEIIIEYSIKHHSNRPSQLKEIFKAGNVENLLDSRKTKEKIIDQLKKKYSKASGWTSQPNGMKFLVVLDQYGWLDDLTDTDKKDMGKVILSAYKDDRLSKEKINNIMNKLSVDTSDFLIMLYEETGDEDFLPDGAKTVFLF